MKRPQRLHVDLLSQFGCVPLKLFLKLNHLHLSEAFGLINITLILKLIVNVCEVDINGFNTLCKLRETQSCVSVGVEPTEDGVDLRFRGLL